MTVKSFIVQAPGVLVLAMLGPKYLALVKKRFGSGNSIVSG
jgi:hypothetical protein